MAAGDRVLFAWAALQDRKASVAACIAAAFAWVGVEQVALQDRKAWAAALCNYGVVPEYYVGCYAGGRYNAASLMAYPVFRSYSPPCYFFPYYVCH